jgi:hypothetical protein
MGDRVRQTNMQLGRGRRDGARRAPHVPDDGSATPALPPFDGPGI